jgi:phage terminase Nu1 subunit (DNA packaging protein)
MVAETRSQGVSTRDRKRVKQQAEAAGLLGISPQRLQEMRRLAPWWKPDLSNEQGWDVVGIAVAQCLFHDNKNDDDGFAQRTRLAELAKVEEEAAIKRLDRQKRERVEAEAEGSLVRVEVVQSLLSEALGELRRLVDDVPFVMSQQVPAEVLPFVYVDETDVKEVSKLSPLQRSLLKVTESYQRWLDRVPEEVFEVDQEDGK